MRLNLIEEYEKLITDKDNFDLIYSSSKKNQNSFYNLFNTNIRILDTLETYFEKFQQVIGLERKFWPKSTSSSQEKYKQIVKFLEHSNFIINVKKNNNSVYELTRRGAIFKNFLKKATEEKWSKSEKYIIFLLNILDYNNFSLIKQTEKNFDKMTQFYKFEDLNLELLNMLLSFKKQNNLNFMMEDLFIIHSLLYFKNFTELYYSSNKLEKNLFKNYLVSNYNAKNVKCPLYKKYKMGGSFSKNTLFNEFLIFYFIYNTFIKNKKSDLLLFEKFFRKIINSITVILNFNNKDNINVDKIINYVIGNKENYFLIFEDVFEKIDCDVTNLESEEFKESLNLNYGDIEDKPEQRIDHTYIYGRKKADYIFNKRKPLIRKNANFKCSLENANNCTYFTSKFTNYNYIEVHHLIPRSYSNRFANSIEVLANYIALCPNCHKMLHQGTKEKREKALLTLFNSRKERLKKSGLSIDNEKILFEMYN